MDLIRHRMAIQAPAKAAEYRINPLPVLKGYQQLVDEELVEVKRGRGMFVHDGARERLLRAEREKFTPPRPVRRSRGTP